MSQPIKKVLQNQDLLQLIGEKSNVSSLISLARVDKDSHKAAKHSIEQKRLVYENLKNWYEDWKDTIYLSMKYYDIDLDDIGLTILFYHTPESIDDNIDITCNSNSDSGDETYMLFFPCIHLDDGLVSRTRREIEKRINIKKYNDYSSRKFTIEDIKSSIHPLLYLHLVQYTRSMLALVHGNSEIKKNKSFYKQALAMLDQCLSSKPKSLTFGGNSERKEYETYNKKRYKIKTGTRGGKYIEVNGKKMYV